LAFYVEAGSQAQFFLLSPANASAMSSFGWIVLV